MKRSKLIMVYRFANLLGFGGRSSHRGALHDEQVDEFWVHAVVRVHRFIGSRFLVAEDFTLVHVEGAGSTTKSNSLRAKLTRITDSTPEVAIMLGGIGRIQPFLTKSTGKADFVPLSAGGEHFLGGEHLVTAFRATSGFSGLKRHDQMERVVTWSWRCWGG